MPQGSILGPLLFIIFINDLPNVHFSFNYLLFTDDTNLVASHTNINELIQLVNDKLLKITDWFKNNKLFLNINKTNYIFFHCKRKILFSSIPKLNNNNIEILQKTTTKFLEIIIDQNLN